MTDKPENKPIERLGRSIRTEMRTRATPEQAYHAWADANRWRALLTRLATRVAARRTDALKTTTGDSFSGRVEFVREPRGFCLTVRELNDALLWLTIAGRRGQIEVQAWLSAFSLDPSQVDAFGKKWERRFEEIFQS